MRSTTSERKLELAGETARTGEARADPLKTDLELARKRADNASTVTMAAPVGANDLLCIAFPRHEAVDGNAGEGSKDPDAVTQQNAAGRVPALEIVTATTAAARAMATEVNLSQALKAVAELKARCALAQARQSQVERESTVRVDKLKRELEEATENGPKASRIPHSVYWMTSDVCSAADKRPYCISRGRRQFSWILTTVFVIVRTRLHVESASLACCAVATFSSRCSYPPPEQMEPEKTDRLRNKCVM